MNLGQRQRRRDRRQGARVGQTEAQFFESAMSREPGIFLTEPPRRARQFLHEPPNRPIVGPPVDQFDNPMPLPPGLGCGPGRAGSCDEKIIAKTQTVGALGTSIFSFRTPGAFCPRQMYIVTTLGLSGNFVSSIKAGLDQQIIVQNHGDNPLVTQDLFSIENHCCQVLCLPCICQPAVPYEVTYHNGAGAPDDVTIILVGTYLDASDPRYQTESGCPPRFLTDMSAPGCPPEGADKLVPFGLALGPGASGSVVLETPGAFCPRAMLIDRNGSTFVDVTRILSGLKHQIISGSLPSELFTIDNECCVLACFDCICKPGYPLTLGFRNTDAEGQRIVTGVLIGTYDDACQ